jgi:DNA (cytosine-5)-methyltransferase 1
MRYLSVCSGIEAASAAWQPLGWTPVAFSEIEPFPCSALAHHHPGVPNWGDMTKFEEWPDESIDLLCGGTPCQSFSVAGLRKGLADPRGNLMLTFGAIAAKYRPRWLVWENVPGVLSSNGGRDFGSFLGLLGELGYGFAYRVLDAQYVRVESHPRAVPQRRRRVFVVGHSGGQWQRAAAVLFERESLRGHPAPRRQTGQGVAGTISARTQGGGGLGTDFEIDGGLVPAIVSQAMSSKWAKGTAGPAGDEHHNLIPVPVAFAENSRGEIRLENGDGQCVGTLNAGGGKPGQGTPCIAFPERMSGTQCASSEDVSPALGALNPTAVAFDLRGREGGAQFEGPHATANIRAASGGSSRSYVATQWAVRRLTPLECERLQGFPDGHTNVPRRGKPAADGPRYKALGNSWAVNCARWIGERIEAVDAIVTQTGPEKSQQPAPDKDLSSPLLGTITDKS